MERDERETPVTANLLYCAGSFSEGKFKEFGLSNFAAWEVMEVYHICKSRGWVLPTVYQGMYNPITRYLLPTDSLCQQ